MTVLQRLCEDDPLAGSPQRTSETLDVWVAEVEEAVHTLREKVPADVAERELLLLTRRLAPLQAAALIPDLDDVGDEAAAMLQLTRELGRKLRRRELDNPTEARDLLLTGLGSLPDGDLARILGVTVRTLAAWRRGQAPTRHATRITTLACIVSPLLGSYTPVGVKLWLEAARPELDGKPPLEAIALDPEGTWERLAPTLRDLRG